MTDPDRVIIQTAVTKTKHRRLYRWWKDTPGDKGPIVRLALEWFMDIKPQMDRIENMLKTLIELERKQ